MGSTWLEMRLRTIVGYVMKQKKLMVECLLKGRRQGLGTNDLPSGREGRCCKNSWNVLGDCVAQGGVDPSHFSVTHDFIKLAEALRGHFRRPRPSGTQSTWVLSAVLVMCWPPSLSGTRRSSKLLRWRCWSQMSWVQILTLHCLNDPGLVYFISLCLRFLICKMER